MRKQGPTPPRKQPVQERARFTVDAIVAATRRLLEEEGRERVTTNRVAEIAGVSIGSLYQYFPNKDALVDRVREIDSRAYREQIEPRFEDMFDWPLADAARGIVDLLIAHHRENLCLHNALAAGAEDDLHEELQQRWLETVVAWLDVHAHEIRPANHVLAARIALEAVEALTHGVALRSPELLGDDEYASELTELLVGYLARRTPHA
jgi:AcrR family transcriptional regulator